MARSAAGNVGRFPRKRCRKILTSQCCYYSRWKISSIFSFLAASWLKVVMNVEMSGVCRFCVVTFCLCYYTLLVSCEPKKGLNIDVSYGGNLLVGQLTGVPSSGALLDVSRPVPYIDIRPNELESVNRFAEIALENEAINPVMHEEYYRVLNDIGELSPEEMLSDLIAQNNTLEALKAELGAEERIARLELSGRNVTPQASLPVSYPVSVNPNTMASYL